MKPLRLELQAFGPFAGRQLIDFGELKDKSFFLIHGPTGSGKTSILDGLCFALFGDSSGGEREAKQMRSHHADSDMLTEVRFDFALGADRYRVRRVPEQMRKARRGGGETPQLQLADLWRLTGPAGEAVEQPLCSGWKKVTEAVEGLLGFESRQFRQVIMLPQGKFFEFLKSNSQEREKILQALFGTELYKRIEDHLKQAAADLSRQAEKVRTQRQTLLEQAEADDEAALDGRVRQQSSRLAELRLADEAAAAAARACEAELDAARRLAARFDEFDQAAEALKSLDAQRPGWQQKRQALDAARRAAMIAPHADALAAVDRQLAQESAQSKQLASDAVAARQFHEQAAAALDHAQQRAPEIEGLATRIAELEGLKDKVTALATARAALADAGSAAKKSAAELGSARKARQAATEALTALSTRLQQQRLQAAGLDGLRQTQAALARRLEQVQTLATRLAEGSAAQRQVEAERSAVSAAQAQAQTARDLRDATRQAWVSGQAARLAHELVVGQACPVCGANEHPAPAHATSDFLGDDALAAAEDKLTRAEATQRSAEGRLASRQQAAAALEAREAELRSALGEAPADIDALKSSAEAARAALKAAEAAASELVALDAKLPAAETAVRNAEAAITSAEQADQQAQARQQQGIGQVTEREAGIPAGLGDGAALQSALATAVASRDALRKAQATATQAASQAQERLAQAQARADASRETEARTREQQAGKRSELNDRLKAAGFDDDTAYRLARLDEAALVELETAIQTFDASSAAAVDRHARAQADTRDLTRPDLPATIVRHETVKAALLQASNAVRDAMAVLAQSQRYVEALKRIATAYQDVEARYAVLKKVQDVASGSNAQRMSFQRYVLATLLEEVLAQTTVRLKLMSRGRYEIRRKQRPADQRTASGLDLEVFDHYTGTTRAVETLSGGESFLASLGLALGLSDVVQSYAGGIRLDAIFVDEGFGTLDPEALDFAIRALQDLQQAGRLVGIISHVAELKEWIDARLELTATPNGSVAAFQV